MLTAYTSEYVQEDNFRWLATQDKLSLGSFKENFAVSEAS